MHYGNISEILCNNISNNPYSLINIPKKDSILLHVKNVSLKDIKRWVDDHSLNDVLSPIYYQNALQRM